VGVILVFPFQWSAQKEAGLRRSSIVILKGKPIPAKWMWRLPEKQASRHYVFEMIKT